jgi:hypothetical protein
LLVRREAVEKSGIGAINTFVNRGNGVEYVAGRVRRNSGRAARCRLKHQPLTGSRPVPEI